MQASFDDLGTPLSDLTYCVVDLETTGGAETDRITEIGAVKVRGGAVLGEFATLIDPQRSIPRSDNDMQTIFSVPRAKTIPSFEGVHILPGEGDGEEHSITRIAATGLGAFRARDIG